MFWISNRREMKRRRVSKKDAKQADPSHAQLPACSTINDRPDGPLESPPESRRCNAGKAFRRPRGKMRGKGTGKASSSRRSLRKKRGFALTLGIRAGSPITIS